MQSRFELNLPSVADWALLLSPVADTRTPGPGETLQGRWDEGVQVAVLSP